MRITVFDKDRVFAAQVGAPRELTVTPRRFPLIGTARMVLPLAVSGSEAQRMVRADLIAALRAKSAQVVFRMEGESRPTLTGYVDEAVMDSEEGTLEVLVLGHAQLLFDILGWQAPTMPIVNGAIDQSSLEYRMYGGVAETVVKDVVRQNGVGRLKIPGLVVAPDQMRGKVIAGGVAFRMHPLPDRLYPALELAGIGLSLLLIDGQLVFDVYVPRVYPVTLSVEGGTLKKARHTRKRPTKSRVVVGGPGEGKLRRYRAVTDAALEAEWGFCGEGFRDARDAKDDTEPENITATNATMDARGWETLTEAGKVDGLSITLAESSIFTYGEAGVLEGDITKIRVFDVEVLEPVVEIVLKLIAPGYVSAEPIIGERVDSAAQTQKSLAAVQASQRKEERA